ncbi:MAG: DUF3857 domain-containing protein [Myxococcaceae bacterium]|nr:DUF3857 domain-containing protein [Myxococcaceae bacterium]
MTRALVMTAFLLAGCGTTSSLSRGYLDRAALKVDASKYPDAAAVVLYRSDRYLLETTGDDASEQHRHVAVAILKEGGFDLAEVRIPFSTRQDIIVLKGRVLQPDGTIVEVTPKDVLSDTNGKGERDYQARFFRFPNVQLGSVLEYEWVVRSPWVIGSDDQDTLGEFPVERYEFELVGSRALVFETIEYNSTKPIEVSQLNDGRHRLRFSLENLAARESEEWMPHWTFTEPRWSWRVLGYKVSTMVTSNWYRTWEDIVEGFARRAWTDATLYKDLTERPELSGCPDARCKVEKARAWILEKTSTIGVDTMREKDLAQAFKSGKASARERALILRKVLDEAGVDVKLALTTVAYSRQTARSFPEWEQFNRVLVYVPAQPSIDAPLVIDLEPEHCALGALTSGIRGQEGFVFWLEGGTVGQGESKGEWRPLDGAPCSENVSHDRITARLEGDGTLQARVESRHTGDRAERWEQRKLKDSPSDFRELLRWRTGPISPLARYSDGRWHDCAPRSGECGYGVSIGAPRYAVRNGGRWLFPLNLSQPAFEGLRGFERKHDIHIPATAGTEIEEIELDAPTGFHAANLPDVVADAVPGLAIRLTAERTPRGVKLTRRSTLTPGIYPREHIAKLRPLVEKVRAWRNTVLTFEPD